MKYWIDINYKNGNFMTYLYDTINMGTEYIDLYETKGIIFKEHILLVRLRRSKISSYVIGSEGRYVNRESKQW